MLRFEKIIGGLLIAIPLAAFAFLGTGNGPLFDNVALANYGQELVTICHHPGHNEHTIEVAPPAVQAHLNHGDYLGACI